jgi:hypothetical protein
LGDPNIIATGHSQTVLPNLLDIIGAMVEHDRLRVPREIGGEFAPEPAPTDHTDLHGFTLLL